MRWKNKIRWHLGQDDAEDAAPPMLITETPRDGSWTPGEKIMLAMLITNILWFSWTVHVSKAEKDAVSS